MRVSRVRFRTYLGALALAELPYAAGAVLLGEGVVNREIGWLLAFGMLGAAFSLYVLRVLHERLERELTRAQARSNVEARRAATAAESPRLRPCSSRRGLMITTASTTAPARTSGCDVPVVRRVPPYRRHGANARHRPR